MTVSINPILTRLVLFPALIVLLLGSCHTIREKNKLSVKDHISATVDSTPVRYGYNVSGIYDIAQNIIILQAADTTLENARMFAITFTLGTSRLDTMRMPHLFSESTDAHNKQTQYAQVAWDGSSPDGLLLDNFTYREKGDLKIWLDSRKGDVLTGRFQGLLYNYKQKVIIKDGTFKVRILRR